MKSAQVRFRNHPHWTALNRKLHQLEETVCKLDQSVLHVLVTHWGATRFGKPNLKLAVEVFNSNGDQVAIFVDKLNNLLCGEVVISKRPHCAPYVCISHSGRNCVALY